MEGCVKGSYKGVSHSVSASACASDNQEQCRGNKEDLKKLKAEDIRSSKLVTFGSSPVSFEKWTTDSITMAVPLA